MGSQVLTVIKFLKPRENLGITEEECGMFVSGRLDSGHYGPTSDLLVVVN